MIEDADEMKPGALELQTRRQLVRALIEMALASQDATQARRYAQAAAHEVDLYASRPQ
jgi:hypothetical protein